MIQYNNEILNTKGKERTEANNRSKSEKAKETERGRLTIKCLQQRHGQSVFSLNRTVGECPSERITNE